MEPRERLTQSVAMDDETDDNAVLGTGTAGLDVGMACVEILITAGGQQ